MPRHCHVTATSLPRHCHVTAISLNEVCTKVMSVENFEFDGVFAPESSQEEVATEVRPIAGSFITGHDCCVLAYGQASVTSLTRH